MARGTRLGMVAAAVILLGALASCEEKVTLDAYQSIKAGMTLDEIERLLGGSGEKQVVGGVGISSGGIAGGASGTGDQTTYVWKGKGGSEIAVTFKDGKAISFNQTGL